MEKKTKINRKLILNITVTKLWLLHVAILIIVIIMSIALLFYENHLDYEQTTMQQLA